MTITFPIDPTIEFYDEDGQLVVMTSPILHRFLFDLYNRTGGDSSVTDQLLLEVDEIRSASLKNKKTDLGGYVWAGVL